MGNCKGCNNSNTTIHNIKKAGKTAKQIIKGYTFLAIGNDEATKLYNKRIVICKANCSNTNIKIVGFSIIKGITIAIPFCKACGCYLNAALRVPDKECKLKYWRSE